MKREGYGKNHAGYVDDDSDEAEPVKELVDYEIE